MLRCGLIVFAALLALIFRPHRSREPCKTAERIEMPFGLWTRMSPSKHVLQGCTLAQPGEYGWTNCVRRRCGLFAKLLWPLVPNPYTPNIWVQVHVLELKFGRFDNILTDVGCIFAANSQTLLLCLQPYYYKNVSIEVKLQLLTSSVFAMLL